MHVRLPGCGCGFVFVYIVLPKPEPPQFVCCSLIEINVGGSRDRLWNFVRRDRPLNAVDKMAVVVDPLPKAVDLELVQIKRPFVFVERIKVDGNEN